MIPESVSPLLRPAIDLMAGNRFIYWIVVIGSSAVSAIIIKTLLNWLRHWLRKREKISLIIEQVIDLIDKTDLLALVFIFIYIWGEPNTRFLEIIMISALTYQVGKWGLSFIRNWNQRFFAQLLRKDAASAATINLLGTVAQGAFIVVITLIALSEVGVDIQALLTGLGVGGIAVALAAQNILGDLLASFSIILDRPFTVGDQISIGPDTGTVEYIGIKTTRLRSPNGEQIIFSNRDMLNSRIRNHRRMRRRRIEYKLSVARSTPMDKVTRIPEWIRESAKRTEKLEFDRCHIKQATENTYDFELVVWIDSSALAALPEQQEQLLVEAARILSENGVELRALQLQ